MVTLGELPEKVFYIKTFSMFHKFSFLFVFSNCYIFIHVMLTQFIYFVPNPKELHKTWTDMPILKE